MVTSWVVWCTVAGEAVEVVVVTVVLAVTRA